MTEVSVESVNLGRGAESIWDEIRTIAALSGFAVMNTSTCHQGMISLRMEHSFRPSAEQRGLYGAHDQHLGSAVVTIIALPSKALSRGKVYYFDKKGERVSEADAEPGFAGMVGRGLDEVEPFFRELMGAM